MKTKPITFYVDDWAIVAAIVRLHYSDRLPFGRITRTRVRDVVTGWYELFGESMGSMGVSDLNVEEFPAEDDVAWELAENKAVRLGLVEPRAEVA